MSPLGVGFHTSSNEEMVYLFGSHFSKLIGLSLFRLDILSLTRLKVSSRTSPFGVGFHTSSNEEMVYHSGSHFDKLIGLSLFRLDILSLTRLGS